MRTFHQRFCFKLKSAWTNRVLIACLSCLIALFVEWQRPELVIRLDEGLRDTFYQIVADPRHEERLTIIDIDEVSLRELGPWPWPRQQVADLVEILLGSYGARAVALDMVFPEPGDAQGDARLASLAAHGPVTLAQIFDYTPRQPINLAGHLAGGLTAPPAQASVPAYGYLANHTGLAGARCVGNIGYQPDADGVLRHTPVHTAFGGKSYPLLTSALLACGQKDPVIVTTPTNTRGLWRVPYSRNLLAYTVISAAEILNESAPRALLAGRYVLVGSSALGLGDRVSTPLTPLSSGIMVHAASLTGLLDMQAGLLSVPWSGRSLLLAWCVLSIALAVYLIAKVTAWQGLFFLFSLVVGWLSLAFWGVSRQAEWSVTAPLFAYLFLVVVAMPHEWWQSQHRSRQLLRSFSHYVAKPVLDEIVRLNLQHSLQPRLLDVTVLVADMEGYTRATSSLSLDQAAVLTKDFLACLTRPVLNWQGTLDKYTGDGLVAFWGAPLPCPDQADRAVSAALGILAEVAELNMSRTRQGLTPVQVRMGIESGNALVGDLGTAFRSTYTAVGDCINFASRLEAAARYLPTQLVVGPVANRKLLQHATKSLGEISLRDTSTTIEVFEVVDENL